MFGELEELLREQRVLIASLQATARRMNESIRENRITKGPTVQRLLLLQMAESLISAHKAAKIDDEGYTLDLIEDAMRHVGKRLAKEVGDDTNLDTKRLRAD